MARACVVSSGNVAIGYEFDTSSLERDRVSAKLKSPYSGDCSYLKVCDGD